jgi:hypothetical protein
MCTANWTINGRTAGIIALEAALLLCKAPFLLPEVVLPLAALLVMALQPSSPKPQALPIHGRDAAPQSPELHPSTRSRPSTHTAPLCHSGVHHVFSAVADAAAYMLDYVTELNGRVASVQHMKAATVGRLCCSGGLRGLSAPLPVHTQDPGKALESAALLSACGSAGSSGHRAPHGPCVHGCHPTRTRTQG